MTNFVLPFGKPYQLGSQTQKAINRDMEIYSRTFDSVTRSIDNLKQAYILFIDLEDLCF